jgi:hypothetical protein
VVILPPSPRVDSISRNLFLSSTIWSNCAVAAVQSHLWAPPLLIPVLLLFAHLQWLPHWGLELLKAILESWSQLLPNSC